MFGFIDSADLAASASNNVRRKVFYQYPQGAFPLMGLLSLVDDAEEWDKSTSGWVENRFIDTRSTTVSATAAGPFTDTSGGSGAVGTDKTAAGFGQTAGDIIRVRVADASIFRERDNIWIKDLVGTSSSVKQLKGTIVTVWPTPNTIDVRIIETFANLLNSTANNGKYVTMIGSAAVEGGFSKKGGVTLPLEVFNNSQIFRTVIGPFSRNALKMGQKFDFTGIYKTASVQACQRHMEAMEQAAYWGTRSTLTVTDTDDGETKVVKTMGGIQHYLKSWELGTVANGAEANYRPGGADITALAWNASDDKRILSFGGATITEDQFNQLIQRIFMYNSDAGWEKLVICGNGLLASINAIAQKGVVKMVKMDEKSDEYGMKIVSWSTVFGDLHFKTHPLFTRNPSLTNSGFVVDVGCLKYHAFQDSDTELLAHRQPRDFDGRKDEWLTEYALEINFPENHAFIDNLGGITL